MTVDCERQLSDRPKVFYGFDFVMKFSAFIINKLIDTCIGSGHPAYVPSTWIFPIQQNVIKQYEQVILQLQRLGHIQQFHFRVSKDIPVTREEELESTDMQNPGSGWQTHMLNVQVTYNGYGLSPAQKNWLGKQVTGLVNILLDKQRVPKVSTNILGLFSDYNIPKQRTQCRPTIPTS